MIVIHGVLRLTRPPMRGPDVAELQRRLGIKETGIFGYTVSTAVRKFQRDRGLEADGIVGPLVWTELAREKAP